MNKQSFKIQQFQVLLHKRELCALYLLSAQRNTPQNLQLFETQIHTESYRWIILPTPVSSFEFFRNMNAQGFSAQEVLNTLHRHKEFGSEKKLLVDTAQNLTYGYIPNLRSYLN